MCTSSAFWGGLLQTSRGRGAGYRPPQLETEDRAGPGSRGPARDHLEVRVAQWRGDGERASLGPGGPDMERGRSLPEGDQEVSSQLAPPGFEEEEEGREPMLLEKVAGKFWWLSAFFTALEYPFVLLRRATIPLVEAEGYSRPWFLVSLVGAPLAVCAYLGLPWPAYLIGGGSGGLAALSFALLLPVVRQVLRCLSPFFCVWGRHMLTLATACCEYSALPHSTPSQRRHFPGGGDFACHSL